MFLQGQVHVPSGQLDQRGMARLRADVGGPLPGRQSVADAVLAPPNHVQPHQVHQHCRVPGHGKALRLMRGTIANRTYGMHNNLYIKPFLLTVFGPINYAPP